VLRNQGREVMDGDSVHHGEVGMGPVEGPMGTLGGFETGSWKRTLDLKTPKALSYRKV